MFKKNSNSNANHGRDPWYMGPIEKRIHEIKDVAKRFEVPEEAACTLLILAQVNAISFCTRQMSDLLVEWKETQDG